MILAYIFYLMITNKFLMQIYKTFLIKQINIIFALNKLKSWERKQK